MGVPNNEAVAGRRQPRSLGDSLQRLVQTKTIRLGGTTAGRLGELLLDQHRVYQGWLSSEKSTDCERDVASLRLIAIEEVLRQLGVEVTG